MLGLAHMYRYIALNFNSPPNKFLVLDLEIYRVIFVTSTGIYKELLSE